MQMSDSQAIALIKLLLEQQRDILHMKAHLLALEQTVVDLIGAEAKTRIQNDILALQQSATTLQGTRAAIEAFEQLLNQAMPATDARN